MKRPNFLFLITDHQQAATVNDNFCHTPNTDRLIAEGMRFRRCYTVNAICSPARATLFTGLHVHAHGMYDCTHTVDDARARFRTELPTWSQALADAGYHCAYFGKWHVERSMDLSRFGWRYQLREPLDEWRREYGYHGPEEFSVIKALGGHGYRERPIYGVVDDPKFVTETEFYFSRGAEYLEEQLSADEPWCLFLSTEEPHDPYFVARRYYEMYDPNQIPQPASFADDLCGKPNVLKRIQRVLAELTWEDFAQATCCYYGVITQIDEQVGRVLEVLERTGQMDNTIIIYLTDHADMMGAHRLLAKGVTPYEEVYKVPLIIRDPYHLSGADCDRIVSLGDVCPAVLEWAGLGPFEVCHFDSLVPLLTDPDGTDWRDEAYAEFHGQRYFYTQRILWRDHLKFIMNAYDFDEMYDLEADPAELNNVADDPAYTEQKEEMLKGIWRNIHATGDETLGGAHYWTMSFFDLGPDCVEHDPPRRCPQCKEVIPRDSDCCPFCAAATPGQPRHP